MADLPRAGASTNISAQTITAAAETIVVTSPAIAAPFGSMFVAVFGFLQMSTGAGVTGVTARIRRGAAVTGLAVGGANSVAAAASTAIATDLLVLDTLTAPDAAQYSLTIQQGGAPGNGTVNQATILILLF